MRKLLETGKHVVLDIITIIESMGISTTTVDKANDDDDNDKSEKCQCRSFVGIVVETKYVLRM
jgi:hypothetical protein